MSRLPALALGLCLLTSSVCGWSVGGAREAAAVKSCEYFRRCEQLGAGKAYASAEECLTQQRSSWLGLWPTATCEGRIDAQALDSCLKAVDNTQCNNPLDLLATLSKCQAASVCK